MSCLPRIHVAATAWRRPDYTRRTLESFWHHNRMSEFRPWFGLDGGQEPEVAAEVASIFGAYGYSLAVMEEENVGVARLTDHLIRAVAERAETSSDLVLLLQNDWESVRPVPIGAVRQLLAGPGRVSDPLGTRTPSNPRVGCMWLYGRYRERGNRAPVGTRHWGLPGAPEIAWTDAVCAGEQIKFGRAYWSHPPSVTRLALARELTAGATDEKESFARSGRLDYLTAWLQDPVFYHIGAESDWRSGGKR